MASSDLTLHEAAAALGVHYMTVYRYVRLGQLPAIKVGGTWRVAADQLDLVRQHGLDERGRSDLAATSDDGGPLEGVAAGAGGEHGRRRAPWAERLEARLVAGDGPGAWSVVEAALTAGADVDEVYLDLIAPAMRSIGRRWGDGELDVAVEHRATVIVFRLLGRLGPRFARRGRTRGVVVLGAPEGERHSLPVALVADLLRGEGWEVVDLGADLPTASFVAAAAAVEGLVAVGVSVSSAAALPAAGELLAALGAALPERVLRVVGGAVIEGPAHARQLGAHGWAASARELVTLLEQTTRGGAAPRVAIALP